MHQKVTFPFASSDINSILMSVSVDYRDQQSQSAIPYLGSIPVVDRVEDKVQLARLF